MRKYPIVFRCCKAVYNALKRVKVEGVIRDEPCVFLARHKNVQGVIRAFCDIPTTLCPWSLAVFTTYQSAKKHFSEYTFLKRTKKSRLFRAVFSPLCAVLLSSTLKKLNAVPVYRKQESAKSITTIKTSVNRLENGQSLLIFPDVEYQDETEKSSGEIYSGFSFIDLTYFKRNKKHIPFVPVYINKNTTKILPPLYLPTNPTSEEKTKFILDITNGIYQGKF